jgi:acetyl-CoA carboxylase carboxyl transferase subunit beta
MSRFFRRFSRKKDIPRKLWVQCPGCSATLFRKKLAENLQVCDECDHHFPITGRERIAQLSDKDSFDEMYEDLESNDPLNFTASEKAYKDILKKTQDLTGEKDACHVGEATMDGKQIVLVVTDSHFMMGSMGSVVGEKVARGIERAHELNCPFISVAAGGGGARMHEAPLSLMQMPKTAMALSRFQSAGGLYISILTHPTMGGVMASYAALGDVIIAEPKALVGFAGPRVIMETIKQTNLPDSFQTSEFMLEHGMIDMISPRPELRNCLIEILKYLAPSEDDNKKEEEETDPDEENSKEEPGAKEEPKKPKKLKKSKPAEAPTYPTD